MAGAKAQRILRILFGTTSDVPCYKTSESEFFAGFEVLDFPLSIKQPLEKAEKHFTDVKTVITDPNVSILRSIVFIFAASNPIIHFIEWIVCNSTKLYRQIE